MEQDHEAGAQRDDERARKGAVVSFSSGEKESQSVMIWKTTDTPPSTEDYVLLHFESGGLCPIVVGRYAGDDVWLEVKGDHEDEVDYPPSLWMPLPEMPE